MQIVVTEAAPARPKLFSQAIIANGLVFVSGQLPMRLDGSLAGTDITAQTSQALDNVGAILKASYAGFEDVVKATVFLTDLNDFEAFNQVWGRYFSAHKPARSTVEVSRLALGARIEIEVIARVPQPRVNEGA